MCGITGFADPYKKDTPELLDKMTDTLSHRGPDARGAWFKEFSDFSIGFGHRRLSIIDLSERGQQPMLDNNGTVIVFNGEIYNYQSVQKELKVLGVEFKSDSDTEVVLKAYREWGIHSVNRFIGMFAYSIFDPTSERVYLMRDRAGVKPLYYTQYNKGLMFGSELKALYEHPNFEKIIDEASLQEYLNYSYIGEERTIFKDVFKLLPGHYLEYDCRSGRMSQHQYWNSYDAYAQPELDISYDEALAKTEELMESAFNYRMVADVPVGLFLSGGYDSSAVAALLQKNAGNPIKTFTIGFAEEKYDESRFAREVAGYLGTEHYEYICTQEDALEIVARLPFVYDEPFGDSSAIPTIMVSEKARKEVKVALSADAGDELFAGYTKYSLSERLNDKFSRNPHWIRNILATAMGFVRTPVSSFLRGTYNVKTRIDKLRQILGNPEILNILDSASQYFSHTETSEYLRNIVPMNPLTIRFEAEKSVSGNLKKMLAMDYRTYLVDDILTKVDRATMSVSLEGRDPLLDHRLLEFAAVLPSDFKNGGTQKRILKDITHKYIPKNLLDRPKKGFGVPLASWFRRELTGTLRETLNIKRLEKHGLLDSVRIVDLVNNFLCGRNENPEKIWLLLMFQMWFDRWCD